MTGDESLSGDAHAWRPRTCVDGRVEVHVLLISRTRGKWHEGNVSRDQHGHTDTRDERYPTDCSLEMSTTQLFWLMTTLTSLSDSADWEQGRANRTNKVAMCDRHTPKPRRAQRLHPRQPNVRWHHVVHAGLLETQTDTHGLKF